MILIGIDTGVKTGFAHSIDGVLQDWQEFCERYDIPHLLVAPASIDTKRSAKDFKMITGWNGRTSEHSRDAGMLIYKYHRLIEKGVVDAPAPKPIKKEGSK